MAERAGSPHRNSCLFVPACPAQRFIVPGAAAMARRGAMKRTRSFTVGVVILTAASITGSTREKAMNLQLHLRSRVESSPGSGQWKEVTPVRELPARETAILICDMWDKHWC